MARSDFKHFFCETIRWGDCDALGHVNNVIFLRYIESARIDYFMGITGVSLTSALKAGWILADVHCVFKQQLKFPSKLDIGSKFTKIGNSSTQFESAIFIAGESEPVFISTAVLVWFDYEKQKPARVPDHIRSLIKDFEKDCARL